MLVAPLPTRQKNDVTASHVTLPLMSHQSLITRPQVSTSLPCYSSMLTGIPRHHLHNTTYKNMPSKYCSNSSSTVASCTGLLSHTLSSAGSTLACAACPCPAACAACCACCCCCPGGGATQSLSSP